jgi:hypothetical protein
MTQPTFRDAEQLSAYPDGALSQAESARLEARLKTDPALAAVYRELRQSRALLRQLPARRAPRNFTLTPKMAGIKPPLPRSFSIFRLASALAAILFFFTYAINISGPAWATVRAVVPAPALGRGGGGGGGDPIMEQAAATEAPMTASEPSDAVTQDPQPTEQLRMAETSTEIPAEPGADMQNPVAVEAQPFVESQPTAKMQPIQIPISPWLQIGLLALAVLSGGAAYFLRLRSDQSWFKANALNPAKISRREALLLALAVILALALAASLYWLATTPFYEPQVMQYPSGPLFDGGKNIPPGSGEKGLIAPPDAGNKGPVTPGSDHAAPGSGNKGSTPMTDEVFTFTPGIGYNFSAADGTGRITAVDFPENAFAQETPILYLPGAIDTAPTGVDPLPSYAFTLRPSPEDAILQAPIIITTDYDANLAAAVDENKLLLYWWSGEEWREAASTCDPAAIYERQPEINRLRVQVCQLGLFMLVIAP